MRFKKKSAAVAVLTTAALVASSSGAWAADVDGQLVRAVQTSAWPIPSPDPSGIAVASNGNLTISDGEVEEINLYEGANIFHTTRSGQQVGTTTTVPWSDEPTGIAYHPNGTVFISDDDADAIFIADSLTDTSPAQFSTTPWIPDPEGVAYDTLRGELLIANGEGGAGFARVNPGPDRRFATGDDTHTAKIDLGRYGAIDTEGIAYDGVRDTVVVVDDTSQKIYELSANGTLMNTIDISGMGIVTAAGVEVAQASDGSSARHYYVVDRGRDPGTNPDSQINDGMMHEIRAINLPSAGPGVNQPPTADAGPDKVVTVPGPVTLAGSGVDTVTPASQLTFAWSRVSGPGTVTFGSANAATTNVTFTAAGQHQFRLTVTDGQGATGTDTVLVTVAEVGGTATVELTIASSTDDAREGNPTTPTFVDVGTRTNDLGTGATGAGVTYPSKVGLRFTNVPVPKGAEIVSAKIQFMADQPSTGAASLRIAGEAADNARTFANVNGSRVSDRAQTSARVTWAAPAWGATNDRGPAQLTPDLKALLQEIVNRPNWVRGNAAAFVVEGSGRRIARSFDAATATGAAAKAAPSLLLQFKTAAPEPEPEPSEVTLRAGRQNVPFRAPVGLRGVVSGAAEGTTVNLFVRRAPGFSLERLGEATTNAAGAFVYVDRPEVKSRYFARAAGLRSSVVRVMVRPRLTSRVTKRSVPVGTRTAVVGRIVPAVDGQVLRLQRWTGTRWRVADSKTLAAGARVRYRFVVVPRWTGVTRYRVVAPPKAGRIRAIAGPEAGHPIRATRR